MGSTLVVERKCEPGLVHGSNVSHHAESRRNRNEITSRGASSLSGSATSSNIGHRSRALVSVFFVFFLWASLFGTASATNGDRLPALLAIHVEDDLAWKGSALHIDHRAPPTPPVLMPPLYNDEAATTLSKRAISTDPGVGKSDFTVPEPFDTGLSSNFTGSCTTFLTRLRTNDSFRKCHPFSLMLQTSSGFFDASKSYLRITQTLDATCGVNATQCKQIMDGYARELITASACKADLDSNTPLVIQALNGLVAYPVAYTASCLRDSEGSYCFANAVSNTSSTTDSYPYYLPIGQELPAGSRPSCNSCLQDAMSVFSRYSNNVSQPLSKTYGTAASQLSIACGRSFINVTAAPLKAAAPTTTTSAALTPTLTLFLMFILYFFQ